MITLSRIMLLLVVLALMAACTSNPRVQSDYNSDLDLGQYKTFDFSSRTEIEDPDLTGILELYFSAAIIQKLLTTGLVQSVDPDILINVSVDLEDVRQPANYGNSNCPQYENYYSYRGYSRVDGSAAVNASTNRPLFCIFSQGSIVVNMVDVELNRKMWEGVSLVRLDAKKDRGAELLMSVSYDVAEMFGETPVRDGKPVSWMVSIN